MLDRIDPGWRGGPSSAGETFAWTALGLRRCAISERQNAEDRPYRVTDARGRNGVDDVDVSAFAVAEAARP